MPAETKHIGTIEKNRREEIRVGLSNFNGYDLVNLRVFFEPQGGGDRRPGKDGLAFQVHRLPEFIKALQDTEAEARRQGLLE